MTSFLEIPAWFLGFGFGLEILFGLITLLVSFYAYRIYKLSNHHHPQLFSLGFLFISIAYWIQTFFSYMVATKLNESICSGLKIQNIATLNMITITLQIIFFTAGLITLVYMTSEIHNNKFYLFGLFTIILSLLLNPNRIFTFYVLSSLFLLFVIVHYYKYIFIKKHKKGILMLIAFILLFLSTIDFLFITYHESFIISGHILELGAYILILINLITVLRRKNEH